MLGLLAGDASVLSEARIRDGVRAVMILWRAFDKTVSGKPLAFAVGAVYGNSIDLGLEVIAKKGTCAKRLVIDARQCTAPSVHLGNRTPWPFFFQRRDACPVHAAAPAASGFVLTSHSEVIPLNGCSAVIWSECILDYNRPYLNDLPTTSPHGSRSDTSQKICEF